ncbi:hypothetical protein ACI2LF_27565 [Kribbella sp. NPDC020789]
MAHRSQFGRRTVVAGLGLALAATGFGVAGAVHSTAATSVPAASQQVVAKSITIKADRSRVKVASSVVLRGKTTGIAPNTPVRVDRFDRTKNVWVRLQAITRVNRDGTYRVGAPSGPLGLTAFRVVADKTISPSQFVTVTR